MADYGPLGGVKIAGFISPGDTTDTYAVIDTQLGIDGLRNYSGTTTEVLSGTTVPLPRRRAGMIVGVEGGDRYFKLKDKDPWDFDLTDWEELDFSGGGSGSAVTGGTYSAGTLTLINGSGGTITVTGFSSNNIYVTGGTVSTDGLLFLNWNNGGTANPIDLSGLIFTGNTSGDCITELWVNNISGCTGEDLNIGAQSGQDINIDSNTNIFGDLTVNGESIFSGNSSDVVKIFGSGDTSPIFSVEGSVGELFTITDSLTGQLFAVNNVSGLPILEVYDDNTILMGNNLAPSLNTTIIEDVNSGQSTLYSIPLTAYTGAFFEYTVKNTVGVRAGSIMSVFSGTSIEFNETTTNDIGDTTNLSFNMSVTGTSANLLVSATTNNWEIKTIIRSI